MNLTQSEGREATQSKNWSTVRAGKIGKFKGGSGFPTRHQGNAAGQFPFYKVSDMNIEGNETFMKVANNYVSESVRRQLGATDFPAGTIVLAKVGAAIFLERKKILSIPACLDNNMVGFTIDEKIADSRYIHHWLLNYRLSALVAATALPSLNNFILNKIEIELPPTILEQKAIAEALSDADVLIESVDHLIAKKRLIKEGLMEDLLTGRKRLPGYTSKWDVSTVGELLSFKNGLNKAKQFFGYGTPIINYMDVFESPQVYGNQVLGRVSLADSEIRNFEVLKGDVLFTRTSETPAEVGLASVVSDVPANTTFSGFLLRGRPKNSRLDDLFKAFCFRSRLVRRQIVSMASYTTRALTNGKALSTVVMPVPTLEEQSAIAMTLADMDADIAILEAKLKKLKQIKLGMMQELLTGRIRLV